MQPIRNQILFKPFPPEEISEGGLFIPESAREISNKGIIVKVGSGTKEKPMKLKQGDVGYRVKGWGCEVMVNGELHFLMDMDAILATE